MEFYNFKSTMGCGSSKGKAATEEVDANIEFKELNVASMDRFFEKAKETLDNF